MSNYSYMLLIQRIRVHFLYMFVNAILQNLAPKIYFDIAMFLGLVDLFLVCNLFIISRVHRTQIGLRSYHAVTTVR